MAGFTALFLTWPCHLKWDETMNETTFIVQRFILPISKLSKAFNCCRMLGSYAPYASCSHFHTFSSCFLIKGKIGGMALHPAPCGGRAGTYELGTAGEEVGTAGGGTYGGAGREVDGGGGGELEVDGAAEAAVFIPSRVPPCPFPRVPDGRRRVLPTGSIDAGSRPLSTGAAQSSTRKADILEGKGGVVGKA